VLVLVLALVPVPGVTPRRAHVPGQTLEPEGLIWSGSSLQRQVTGHAGAKGRVSSALLPIQDPTHGSTITPPDAFLNASTQYGIALQPINERSLAQSPFEGAHSLRNKLACSNIARIRTGPSCLDQPCHVGSPRSTSGEGSSQGRARSWEAPRGIALQA